MTQAPPRPSETRDQPHRDPEVWTDTGRAQVVADDDSSERRPRVLTSLDHSLINRFGLVRFTYARLLRRAGAKTLRVVFSRMPEANEVEEDARRALEPADALLLSGGGDVDPALYGSNEPARGVNERRDRFELALLRQAREQGMAVFGVCRGSQLLNVATGGTLHTIRDDPQRRKYHHRFCPHPVALRRRSALREFIGARRITAVRSFHGQAVWRTGPEMRVAARAFDHTVEAIESTDLEKFWAVGFQWHPELMLQRNSDLRVLQRFVNYANTHRRATK